MKNNQTCQGCQKRRPGRSCSGSALLAGTSHSASGVLVEQSKLCGCSEVPSRQSSWVADRLLYVLKGCLRVLQVFERQHGWQH